ncbi:hypothetical protein CSC42_0530 [Pseudomonas aeruginosa]|nr:hypothetical protein CSC42_0028 [Pseudomonas aeruginosa]RCH20469.1 hypothetical protein CSC42_0530 [Pseudomonas aeruginosa]
MVAIDRVEELGGMAEIVEKRAMYSVKLCLPERDGFNTVSRFGGRRHDQRRRVSRIAGRTGRSDRVTRPA